jgi:hypothetical protein
MTPSDLQKLGAGASRRLPGAKPSKYRNVRIVVDGETFDSKAEAAYWQGLKLREKAGEIHGLQRQIHFPLYAPSMDEAGIVLQDGSIVVSEYIADFVWREGPEWRLVVADKKGKRTTMYLLKRKWLELQQGIQILEV